MTNQLAPTHFPKLALVGAQGHIAPSGRVIRSANRHMIPKSAPANSDSLPLRKRNIIRRGGSLTSTFQQKRGVNLGKTVCAGFLIGTISSVVLLLPSGAFGGISSRSMLASMKRDLAETTTSLSPHVLAHARKTIRTTTSTALIKQRESILHIPTLLADRIQTSANIGGDKQRMRLASFVAVPHDVQGRQAIPQGASQASSLVPMAERPSPRGVVGRVHTIIRKYAPKHQSPQELAHAIVTESRNQGYDPLFVAAVIKAESTFNAAARSNKGAQGLMQIMPATGAWLAKRNDLPRGKLTDPGHNLRLGISYLKHLESEYSGDKVFTLVAYNWGPGHVQSATGGKRRIPKECMTYARKILQDYQRWQSGLI